MKIIGIIPARGGSKSIKLKNIVDLNGKPLIYYTAKAALNSKYIEKTFVSTDNQKILKIAKNLGLNSIGLRSKKLSKDDTSTLDVIYNFIEEFKKKYVFQPDAIILLQPTSPFRTAQHIDSAIKKFIKFKPSSLVSVCKVPHRFNPDSQMTIKYKNYLQGLNGPLDKQKMNRNEKKNYYARNGAAIYIIPLSTLMKKKFFGLKPMPFEMDYISSIDIDNKEDLKLASLVMKNSN